MQTYRRLASTATSTSRSASTASMHQHAGHTHGRISRSSSTTSTSTMTPVEVGSSYSRMAIPISRGLPSPTAQRNASAVFVASPPTAHDQYTRAELETIAESLLAHVTFGPYHLASSPVPSSSHLRLAMANAAHRPDTKENNNVMTSPLSASTTSLFEDSSTPTLHPLGPSSSSRHFEGKEGSRYDSNNHHPRARFTIGGGAESERGRGMGRKSVGLSVRDVNHTNEFGYERERGRDMRGRSGNVKGLQYS